MKIKKIAGVVHLWLGLVCGLVVVVSMTAAALYAWEEELTHWFYHDIIYVQKTGDRVLPFSILHAKAQAALPGKPINGLELKNSNQLCYEFSTYNSCDSCEGWWQWREGEYWDKAYVDPYTGEVTGTIDMLRNWIMLTRSLHQNLLLRYEIGHYVVGISTLVVLVLVVTGLVLWFPRNKAALRQRFKISFKSRWRRVNYDIHNVGGFYAWLVIVFLAVTGLVWTFEWWENGISRILGSKPDEVWEKHVPFKTKDSLNISALDKAIASFHDLRPSWTTAYISLPKQEKDSIQPINVYLGFNSHSGWDEMDEYQFHPVTGKVIAASLQEKKTVAAKWRNSNYAFHVGSIYGWPTKVLACCCTLFLASLPITGFYIWWGRKKKPKKLAKS